MQHSFEILFELKKILTQVDGISTTLSTVAVLLFLVWFSYSFFFSFLAHLYVTCVSNSDFIRLISTESNPLVIQFIFPFKLSIKWYGYYYYWSYVKGHRFFTASKEPLELPESCELIQAHQPSKFIFFRNLLSGKTQQSPSHPNEEDSHSSVR